MRTVGDMWGMGSFKANACDFCDDVTAELADISIGDAWLEPYVTEWQGTNVVVTRSTLAERIINEGIQNTRLNLETLSIEKLISTQQGSFNHRHSGLLYRIQIARKKKRLIPPKRISEGSSLRFDLKIVQRLRLKVREKSLEVWKNTENAVIFDDKMKLSLVSLKISTRLNHYLQKIVNKLNK